MKLPKNPLSLIYPEWRLGKATELSMYIHKELDCLAHLPKDELKKEIALFKKRHPDFFSI